MFEIRNISPNDINGLLELMKKEDVVLDNIHSFLDNFLICKWEGDICGFGFGLIENDSFFIKGIYIRPNYRNKGLGSAIIKALINKCDVQNINKLYICGKETEFFISLQFTQISTQHFIENNNVFFSIYEKTTSSNIYFVNVRKYVFNSCCQ